MQSPRANLNNKHTLYKISKSAGSLKYLSKKNYSIQPKVFTSMNLQAVLAINAY